MANILILGGIGFLGSNLCDYYGKIGDNIFVVDDFSTNFHDNASLLNSKYGKRLTIFNAMTQDLRALNIPHIDLIFNFATPAGPQKFQAEPATVISKLMRGAIATMEFAHTREIPVLIASTSEVYGDPLVQPQDEKYLGNVDPIGIRSAYNEGKRAEEAIAAGYFREFGVNVKIARIFNTYGPKMDPFDGRMVSAFIMRALQNQPIEILGDGSQIRTLTYVDDLMDALVAQISLGKDNWQPINIGSNEPFSVLEVAQKIIEITKSKSEIIFKPARIGEPYLRTPDITRANEVLNWQPSTKLENGLQKTIEYLAQYI